MSKKPWLKFYPTDWRSDPKLRMCSIAARGLWIELMGIMHEAEPYGHLLVSGRPPTSHQLAALVGASTDQITELLAELESLDVFSRTGDGVVYSRRMTRDARKANVARNAGKKGGNPTLCKQSGISPSVNPPDKGAVNGLDKPHIPETRYTFPNGNDGRPSDWLWQHGVSFLAETIPEKQARSLIGKWIKAHTAEKVIKAVNAAQQAGTGDPVPYITAVLQEDGDVWAIRVNHWKKTGEWDESLWGPPPGQPGTQAR